MSLQQLPMVLGPQSTLARDLPALSLRSFHYPALTTGNLDFLSRADIHPSCVLCVRQRFFWIWCPQPFQHLLPLLIYLDPNTGASQTSPVMLGVKNPPANAGYIRDTGSVPGLGRSRGGGHGNPSSILASENPTDRGAWQDTVHSVAQSWT